MAVGGSTHEACPPVPGPRHDEGSHGDEEEGNAGVTLHTRIMQSSESTLCEVCAKVCVGVRMFMVSKTCFLENLLT